MSVEAHWVEVLDRSGGVVQRVRCDRLPIRIGRGYGNDVVIDDPYLDAQHLAIEADGNGGLVAVDAGSANGLHLLDSRRWFGRGAPQRAIPLSPDTVVRTGHTLLRVRRASYAVAVARRDTTSHAWEGALPALLGAALLAAVAWFDAWGTNNAENWQAHYTGIFLLVFALGATWAVAWAFLNRLFDTRLRFGRHLLITGVCAAALLAVTEALAQLAYSLSLRPLAAYSLYLALAAIAGAVYFHTRTLRPSSPALARHVAVTALALLVGLPAVFQYTKQQTFEQTNYVDRLRAPASRLTKAQAPTDFVSALRPLAERVDARRHEPVMDSKDSD